MKQLWKKYVTEDVFYWMEDEYPCRNLDGEIRYFTEKGAGLHARELSKNEASKYLNSSVKDTPNNLNVTGDIIVGHGISAPTYDLEKGIKDDKGKLFYELDFRFIQAMAKRMAENKGQKYDLWNWKRDIDVEHLKQAMFRHIIEVMEGNYEDDGESLGHVTSLATNAMMLWHRLKYDQDQKELRKKFTEGVGGIKVG
jgi:hypothetical protein